MVDFLTVSDAFQNSRYMCTITLYLRLSVYVLFSRTSGSFVSCKLFLAQIDAEYHKTICIS